MVRRVISKMKSISRGDLNSVSKETIDKHISRFQKIEKFLYEPPLIKVPIILISAFLLELFISSGLNNGTIFLHSLRALLILVVIIYLLFFIVHLIKRSFKTLLKASNMWSLFFGYALFIFCIIFFFSSVYDTVERFDAGYLKYGQCSDAFNASMVHEDPLISHNYFYFSSVTLFTVGYGDICPMGATKVVAIINSFIGNFINVVLMVWIISNYMKRKDMDENEN